jgi:hypothetical protein
MLFIPIIHIAAPNAPQAPPLKPIPPANPAAMTVCMSDTPIFCASIAEQLTGGEGTSLCFSARAEFISLKAAGAYRAAMRKQSMVPPFKKKGTSTI